jgi:hypothetical protein
MVVYKPGIIHVIVNALSKFSNNIKTTSVPNQTTNASLFYIELEWLNDVKEFLKTSNIQGTLSIQSRN